MEQLIRKFPLIEECFTKNGGGGKIRMEGFLDHKKVSSNIRSIYYLFWYYFVKKK